MTPFITKSVRDRCAGLSLHYPFLHSAVVGLDATRTLEFGAGGSTRVIVEAQLGKEVWEHVSLSTDDRTDVENKYGVRSPHWTHVCGLSQERRDSQADALDLVLHDGAHTEDVVAGDIIWAWPFLRLFGLLLVHDTQHSIHGAAVRAGLSRALATTRAGFSLTTLPYGFGLTIIRKETGFVPPVEPATAKVSSIHTTCLTDFRLAIP